MGTKEQSSNQGNSRNKSHLHFEAIYSNYWKSLTALCQPVVDRAGNSSVPLPFARPSHAIGGATAINDTPAPITTARRLALRTNTFPRYRSSCAAACASHMPKSIHVLCSAPSHSSANTQPQRLHTLFASCERCDDTAADDITLELRACLDSDHNVEFLERVLMISGEQSDHSVEFLPCQISFRDPTVGPYRDGK